MVIAVSALVIVAAVPLLLRARNAAMVATPDRTPVPASAGRVAPGPGPGPSERESSGYVQPDRAPATTALPSGVLDRIWLRCGAGVVAATGAAMLAVALASYLLAVDSTTAAWVALGVAALISIAMCAIPVLSLRQLQGELAPT